MDTVLYELKDYKRTGSLSEADMAELRKAADILGAGGLVAFPTETVYGLGGNALMKDASRRIYAAKGRPSDNPLIVHITDFDEIELLVAEYSDTARKLAEAFWPGPFTMIMPKADIVPMETTGGLSTVALRMPSHRVARELIRLSGVPVAAPSANTSGRPSTTMAEHCMEDLAGRIEAVVDGGSSDIGVESTIVDVSGDRPVLLRPGAVTREMLRAVLGEDIAVDPAVEHPLEKDVHPKAPGMKYRHYAPKAPMVIVTDGTEDRIADRMLSIAEERLSQGLKTGMIASEEVCGRLIRLKASKELPFMSTEVKGPILLYRLGELLIINIGSSSDEESWARELFAALREMDACGVDYIVAEGVDEHDIGFAVMNRLKKAAGGNIISV